jgi:cobalt/nickel transport system permease protein
MKRLTTTGFVVVGIAVALFLAFVISPHASSSPDGLEKVAADKGLDIGVEPHAMADSPLAGYSVKGVDDSSISTGLAGIVGVGVTFAIGVGLFGLLRLSRRHAPTPRAAAEPSASAT